ncbi:MAG TPA: hypothetical protein VMK05_14125 [Burkholderiales bacterium]|nr:hypothetical protein [Burkholderiales bacterium]
MKRALLALPILLLAGCAAVTKIAPGETTVGERLVVKLDGAWNQVNVQNMRPAQLWTMEGIYVDQFRLYSGIKDGQAIHPTGGNTSQKSFNFRSNMQPDEIAGLFEGMLTRDGSRFTLARLEPVAFGGLPGFRLEYALIRKADNVQLSGVGYFAVSRGELFAILYMAPRLAFFQRHVGQVEQIARSAQVKE